jgi:hypothetical protein
VINKLYIGDDVVSERTERQELRTEPQLKILQLAADESVSADQYLDQIFRDAGELPNTTQDLHIEYFVNTVYTEFNESERGIVSARLKESLEEAFSLEIDEELGTDSDIGL